MLNPSIALLISIAAILILLRLRIHPGFAAADALVAVLVALLVASLGVALVNMFYRASYHLATVTMLAIVVTVIWGYSFLPVLAIIPLVGWSRYSLKQHSPAQMAAGVGLAIIVGAGILYSFGLLQSIVV